MAVGSKLSSDIKFALDYSKWSDELQRTELWEDSVVRVMQMHKDNPKFKEAFNNPKFIEYFKLTEQLYKDKIILGSQRALQFGGAPIMKHNARMFNCLSSYCDRVVFFQEAMYWLMNGCGVGFSVQKHHIDKLPSLKRRTDEEPLVFVIPDSIEGWADSFGVLIQSYFREGGFKEYFGKRVVFDYSQIRPKGAMIAGGFKAPGPDGLRKSLEKCETLLESFLAKTDEIVNPQISPITAYDFVMHMSDAVLSGGVRRSATICLFSLDDEEMIKAKTGNWFSENPQRGRSNNSVVVHKKYHTKEQFDAVFESIKQFGEPGFYMVDDFDQATNPCVEIGMFPQTEEGVSGWQGCNLVTSAGAKLTTLEKFLTACRGMAFLGTLQAAYTDFKYVGEETKRIFDREALLGCSITGWMNNPTILLNEDYMKMGAELIVEVNKEVAAMIGINPAARTTCVKPEGNSSVILESASGCHGDHSPQYFRVMQINKESEVAKYLEEEAPILLEECSWSSSGTDYSVFIPTVAKKGSMFKSDLVGIKLLEKVKSIQQNWVKNGTNLDACIRPFLTHNVSNTVDVEDWDGVRDYLWENREFFSGVSFLPLSGDKIYHQAPFTSVLTTQQALDLYGDGAMLAAGLIVDGLNDFDNLWEACDYVINRDYDLVGSRRQVFLQKDWIRRAKQFARRYFKSDLNQMCYCLKDIHLIHKWISINRVINNKVIDISKVELKPIYTEIDTLGAMACAGNACEMPEDFLKKNQ